MARIGSAKGFWEILKSVSITEISQQAHRPIHLAIVGAQASRQTAITALLSGPQPGSEPEEPIRRALPEPSAIQEYDSTAEEAGFPQNPGVFDLVIDVGGGRLEPPTGTAIYSLEELGGWTATLNRILEDRPELALALARNFPAFRRRVAQQIISETAMANAQFALLTGITAALPITAILLPVSSLSDIVILTKNQAMMTLRLAAAYGLPVDYLSRSKEALPLLGNALGWRALARQIVGAVPVAGVPLRAMIAYAGTVTVGKAVTTYYESGESLTSQQARQLYREAYEESREKVRALANALLKSRPDARKRLPAASDPKATPAELLPAAEADYPLLAEETAP
jgi:uncharacterized protein (DUF697 family)